MFSQQASRRKGTPTHAFKSKAIAYSCVPTSMCCSWQKCLNQIIKLNIGIKTFHVSNLHSLATKSRRPNIDNSGAVSKHRMRYVQYYIIAIYIYIYIQYYIIVILYIYTVLYNCHFIYIYTVLYNCHYIYIQYYIIVIIYIYSII
jgi:hypothetical protein